MIDPEALDDLLRALAAHGFRTVGPTVRDGAIVYLCGDGQYMAPAVRDTLMRIYRDATGVSAEAAQTWADTMQREYGRYVEDIFA